jgi:hypothetical protein
MTTQNDDQAKPDSTEAQRRDGVGLGARNCSAESFMAWLTGPDSRETHRREYNDIQWAQMQPTGEPKYKIGDVVEFHVGGYGVIHEVSQPRGGWPSSYATSNVEGYPPHATRKCAWHYEGDFKTWVAKSPLHSLPNVSRQGRREGEA